MFLYLVISYFIGMFVIWFKWRDKIMVGWWFQDLVTLCFWPILALLVAYEQFTYWRSKR